MFSQNNSTKFLSGLCLLILFTACEERSQKGMEPWPFQEVDTSFAHENLRHSGIPIRVSTLFRTAYGVTSPSGEKVAAKKKNDFVAYIPLDTLSRHGLLWVNQEVNTSHDVLGDGGGATVMEIRAYNKEWRVSGEHYAVDFSTVGGTYNNCLGAVTPWQTIITSEEYEPFSNAEIYAGGKGIRDTSDYKGYKKYLHYGWMVEVDPKSRKALHKLWQMGRFSHEGAYCMPDKKTVYLLDDYAPGIFFKFIADKTGDYTQGQLYAYSENGNPAWIPLPMSRDSLNHAREMALKRGATFFIRLEDIDLAPDGFFYLSETGKDKVDLSEVITLGGKPASHLKAYHQGENIYADVYGRILRFQPEKNKMEVYLEAGQAKHEKDIHLANPDNLSVDWRRNQLVIHEDINGTDFGRVSSSANNALYNEIYFLPLDGKPSLDKLGRMAIAPKGSESTGGCWSPDFFTYFMSIQHPDTNNPVPYGSDVTVAITGFYYW